MHPNEKNKLWTAKNDYLLYMHSLVLYTTSKPLHSKPHHNIKNTPTSFLLTAKWVGKVMILLPLWTPPLLFFKKGLDSWRRSKKEERGSNSFNSCHLTAPHHLLCTTHHHKTLNNNNTPQEWCLLSMILFLLASTSHKVITTPWTWNHPLPPVYGHREHQHQQILIPQTLILLFICKFHHYYLCQLPSSFYRKWNFAKNLPKWTVFKNFMWWTRIWIILVTNCMVDTILVISIWR